MMDALLAGCCVTLAVIVESMVHRPRRPLERKPVGTPISRPDAALVLQLIAVAVKQGTSLPRTLMVIGENVGGDYGNTLCKVSRSLHRGAVWRDAWLPAVRGPFGEEFSCIGDVLEDSWIRGASPLGRIDDAVGRIRRRRRASIERGAARLGIRLLVPMGLCFLPAFVLIGVLPSIGSFVA